MGRPRTATGSTLQLKRAFAKELSTHLSAVVVSSRTPFRPTNRTCFASVTVPIDFIFSYIDKNVYKDHIFRD